MDVAEEIEKELDAIAQDAMSGERVDIDELGDVLEMRLWNAQARYYNAVADAMTQPTTDTEDAERADKYTDYIAKKKRYRETKTVESKQELATSLQTYLADIYDRLSEVYRDSDCQEEREQARNFARRLHEVYP